jgi:DNA-binding transcriptional MocR family regulator
MTHTLERRKEILALANEHNFLILEGLRDLPSETALCDADLLVDDPYFYLYFSDQPRPSSYFKLDCQGPYPRGRVLRFDSLSKVLSAGLRFGFATGPARLIERINVHVGHYLIAELGVVLTLGKKTAASNLQGSSTVQAIVQALFNAWGYDTFMEHTRRVASLYRAKRDIFERAMQRHLTGLAEWVPPEAGMFYWCVASPPWFVRVSDQVPYESIQGSSYFSHRPREPQKETQKFSSVRKLLKPVSSHSRGPHSSYLVRRRRMYGPRLACSLRKTWTKP